MSRVGILTLAAAVALRHMVIDQAAVSGALMASSSSRVAREVARIVNDSASNAALGLKDDFESAGHLACRFCATHATVHPVLPSATFLQNLMAP